MSLVDVERLRDIAEVESADIVDSLLRDQIRRAAVSIVSIVAEGFESNP